MYKIYFKQETFLKISLILLFIGVLALLYINLDMRRQLKKLDNRVQNIPTQTKDSITYDDMEELISRSIEDELNISGGVNDKLDYIEAILSDR